MEDKETNKIASQSESAQKLDPKLLEILVCPITKTKLEYDSTKRELISRAAGLAYPIRNGIPVMTVDAAREID